MYKSVLLFLVLILSANATKVTLSNLVSFFNNTLDSNNDGQSTIEQFVKYFRFMEPEHNLTQQDLMETFEALDINSDAKVTLKELVQMAQITINYHPGHKQIHLGFTGKDTEMQVMWVSNPEAYSEPIVKYGLYPSKLAQNVSATTTTYNVGHIGFHGKIYRAVMTNLIHLKRYYYVVGDLKTETYSETKFFYAPPEKDAILPEINYATCGDVGTFAPFGHMIMKQIARDNFAKPFDFMWLTGDIAYAGMNSEKVGETEPIWDLFGELAQSFAAYTPFMPGVGNHERYYNYTSYMARYVLPRSYEGQTNLWYSFDYGQLHIAYVSSEHPYQPGSEQYMFLENDLKKAKSNPNTKWIMVGAHRSFYYADACQYQNVTRLVKELEDLLNQYDVDIVQTGHLHEMERTWPIYKGKALKEGHDQNHFYSPKAPIYIVQGSGGALIRQKYVDPLPEWSLKRMKKYGYGKVRIVGNTLRYQFISAFNGKVLDEWYITK